MRPVTDAMTADHRHCDDDFVAVEAAAGDAPWAEVGAAVERFVTAMEQHFGIEEETLFPAFERRTGMTEGPTRMMRVEHTQMRALFATLREAVADEDRETLLGECETLLVLMQQHNLKEEEILYPMCDQVLGADGGALVAGVGSGGG